MTLDQFQWMKTTVFGVEKKLFIPIADIIRFILFKLLCVVCVLDSLPAYGWKLIWLVYELLSFFFFTLLHERVPKVHFIAHSLHIY